MWMWKCKEQWNIQLTLGIWCRPLSQDAVAPVRHQPHLLIPSAQTINQKKRKEPRNEIHLPTNHILLPWPTNTEPGAKRGRLGTQPSQRYMTRSTCNKVRRRKEVVLNSLDSHMDPSTYRGRFGNQWYEKSQQNWSPSESLLTFLKLAS